MEIEIECDELDSPPRKMARLVANEISFRRFMPVIMDETLGGLLRTATGLYKKHIKDRIQFGLPYLFPTVTTAFTKVLNDDAVNDWEPDMHSGVKARCEGLVELCVCTMDEDSMYVLGALAVLFDPNNKFHTFTATRISESVKPGSDIPDEKLYARPLADPQNPRGWLVDLINKFGNLGGFLVLLTRFQPGRRSLTIRIIRALLRPFGLCHELLTVDTIVEYFMPIVERVPVILDAFTDEELQKEAKIPSINQDVSAIIKDMKSLISRVPNHERIIQNLESLRARTTFRLLLTDKNMNESLAKLNIDLNAEERNQLLELFRTNWKASNDKTRYKTIQDYQADATVHRVLEVLWDLTYSDDTSTRIMQVALYTHVQVFTYFSPQDHHDQVFIWISWIS